MNTPAAPRRRDRRVLAAVVVAVPLEAQFAVYDPANYARGGRCSSNSCSGSIEFLLQQARARARRHGDALSRALARLDAPRPGSGCSTRSRC